MGGLEGQEHALIEIRAGRFEVAPERDEIAVQLDVLLAFGHEDESAADGFAQLQFSARFSFSHGVTVKSVFGSKATMNMLGAEQHEAFSREAM